jgi:hypothetical protein
MAGGGLIRFVFVHVSMVVVDVDVGPPVMTFPFTVKVVRLAFVIFAVVMFAVTRLVVP